MPRKQATVNETSAAAAPARAAKPKAPRVKSATHTKAAPVEPAAITEMHPAVEALPVAALDSTAVANILQAELPIEQVETGMFVSASVPDSASSDVTATQVNADPQEEIARIA